MEQNMPPEMKDQLLWQLAKKRAGFKWSLLIYVVINLLLIGIWYFTSGYDSYCWPIWSIMGWGLAIAFQYVDAYHNKNIFSIQNEYDQLKKKSFNQ